MSFLVDSTHCNVFTNLYRCFKVHLVVFRLENSKSLFHIILSIMCSVFVQTSHGCSGQSFTDLFCWRKYNSFIRNICRSKTDPTPCCMYWLWQPWNWNAVLKCSGGGEGEGWYWGVLYRLLVISQFFYQFTYQESSISKKVPLLYANLHEMMPAPFAIYLCRKSSPCYIITHKSPPLSYACGLKKYFFRAEVSV